MIKLPIELFTSYPVLFILIAIPVAITIIFKVLNARTDNTRVTLKYIEVASSILKPTFNTTNKKQIYLTEKLFHSTYKYPFTYSEILVLLNCESPANAISDFLKVKFFLKLSTTKKSFIERNRDNSSFIYMFDVWGTGLSLFAAYLIFAFSGVSLAIMGLNLNNLFVLDNSFSAIMFYFWTGISLVLSVLLLIVAYRCLNLVFKRGEARTFLKDHF
jgi:hypothetical protein